MCCSVEFGKEQTVQLTYLVFVESGEVVVAEQNTELFLLQRCRQFTETMVSQLWGWRAQKLLSYQCYIHSRRLTILTHWMLLIRSQHMVLYNVFWLT